MLESSREPQDRSLLPPHWIEVKSSVAEPGRDYYFNTKNKKSVWTVREALLSKNNVILRKSCKQLFAPQPPTEPLEPDSGSSNEKLNVNQPSKIKKPQSAPQASTEPLKLEGGSNNEKQNAPWPMNVTAQQPVHNEPSTRPAIVADTQTNKVQHTNLWSPFTAIPPPFYPYNPTIPFGRDPNMPNWIHPNVMAPFLSVPPPPPPPVFPIQRQIFNEKALNFSSPAESTTQYEPLKFPPTVPVFKSTEPPLFDKDSEIRTLGMENLTEKLPLMKPGDLRFKLMARKRAKSVSDDRSDLDWKKAASTVKSRRSSLSLVDGTSDDVMDQSKSDTDSSKQNEEEEDDNFPLKGESFGYWLLRDAKPDTVKDLVYICVDSNIFINQLNLIKEILTRDKEHVCRILVTFRVLNEMEKLKKSSRLEQINVKRDNQTRKRVTTALSFLCEEAMKNPSYIITEKLPSDESERNLTRYNNDDDIIYRIMQYRDQNYHIILLTEDRAMTLKASLLNIHCYNVPNLRKLFKKVEQQIEKRDALLKLKVSVKNIPAKSQEVFMETTSLPPPILVETIPPFNPYIPPPPYVYTYEHMFPRPLQVPSASRPDQGFGKMSAALDTIPSSEKDRTDSRSLRSASSTTTTKSNDSFGRAIINDVYPMSTTTTQKTPNKQQAQRSPYKQQDRRSPYKQTQEQRKKITLKRPAWNKSITQSTSTAQSNVPSNAWDTFTAKNKRYQEQQMSAPVTEPQNPFSAKTKNIQKTISNPNAVNQLRNPFSITTKNIQSIPERQILNRNAVDQLHNIFSTQRHQEKPSNSKMLNREVVCKESLSTLYPSITTASVTSKSFTTTIDSSAPIVPTYAQDQAPLAAQKVPNEAKDDLNIPLTGGLMKRLENQMDMWVVMYTQIMEDVVTTVLLSELRFYMIQPPWSLHEALSTLAERFQSDNKALATAANDLARLVEKYSLPCSHKSTSYTKLSLKSGETFLKLYKDGRALLSMLKAVQNTPVIDTAEKDMDALLDQLRTGKMENEHVELLSELSSDPKTVDDDDFTRDVTQTRDMDIYIRVVKYLQDHYEVWRTANQLTTSKIKPTETIKEFKSKELVTADKTDKLASTRDNGKNTTTELKGNQNTKEEIKKTIEQRETKPSGLTDMLKFKPIPEFESKLQNTKYYEFDSEIDEEFDYENDLDFDGEYDDMNEEVYEDEEVFEDELEKTPEVKTGYEDKAEKNTTKQINNEIVENISFDEKTAKISIDETNNDNNMVDLEKDLSISENSNEINTLPVNETVMDDVEAITMGEITDNTSVSSDDKEEYSKVGDAIGRCFFNYKMVAVQLGGEKAKHIVYADGDATGLPPLPQIFNVGEGFIQCLEKIQKHRRCDAATLVNSLIALAPSTKDDLPMKPKDVVAEAVLVRDEANDTFVAVLQSFKKAHKLMMDYYDTTLNKKKKLAIS